MTLTVEKLAEDAIDVLELNRAGLLTGDWVRLDPSFRWPAIAVMRVARFRIVIEYRHRSVPQSIQISWTRCHYGGVRPYLHCPDCHRRVWRLFRALHGYACRTCCGSPVYESQRRSAKGRKYLRAYRLRQRLGGSRPVLDPIPPRPARMRRRVYERLCAELKVLERPLVGSRVVRDAPRWFRPLKV